MSTNEKHVRGGAVGEPAPPHEFLVLLADPDLLGLPLEALSAVQSERYISLSRDVSLQMLYHRTHIEPLGESIIIRSMCHTGVSQIFGSLNLLT